MSSTFERIPSATRLALGLAFISGSLLALEILYVRLVSILLFPVATYLVISLAMLGLGTSGGMLTLMSRQSITRRLMGLGAVGFSYATLISLAAIWYASDSNWIAMLLPVALSLPMFFGGITLSAVFSTPKSEIPVLYFADLVGAGVAALLALVGLHFLGALQVVFLIAFFGLISGAIFLGRMARSPLAASMVLFGLLVVVSSWMPKGIIPISPKELRLLHETDDAPTWEYQGWSALARVDVLSVPGDRLELDGGIPYMLVTHDGGAPSILLQTNTIADEHLLIENTIFGVPYWLRESPRVLIIGLGGGPDVVAALAGGAREIVGAEVNPEMIAIVEQHFSGFVGDPYSDSRVRIELTDGRHLLASSEEKFDVIQLTGVDTTVASLGANPNLAENYLYTREAFVEYLEHLTDNGLLSISFPNVEGLGIRLLALTSEALQATDVQSFREHVIVGEMTGYVHVLVSKAPFTSREIRILEEHYRTRPTSVYFPLYHRLFGTPSEAFIAETRLVLQPGSEPVGLYSGYADALAADNEQRFLASQPYTLDPPTDAWPFFFVLDKLGFRTPNFDALFLTLALLAVFSFLLMIVPPWILQRRGLSIFSPGAVIGYFACLGLGFIFIEVIFIQKLSLIVGHPSYSLAITLSGLLISSGMGSYASNRFEAASVRKAVLATAAVAVLIPLINLGLDKFGDLILRQELSIRIAISSLIVAVPGFFMGVPFPSGLERVQDIAPTFIPWAWGINATFTVIGTILSLVLAMSFGFGTVLSFAAVLYLVALIMVRSFGNRRTEPEVAPQ